MYSGREALRSIDQTLHQVRSDVHHLGQRLDESRRDLVQIRSRESEMYRQLARVRLDRLERGSLVDGLDAAERRANELLRTRAQALEELVRRLDETEARQRELETKRHEQAEAIARHAEQLDALQAEAQDALERDPEYKAQLARVEQARETVARADEKTRLAEADREEKGKPYEAEPLFMYLWQRGYGTSAYRANPLTRFLDGWVARLSDFHDARPNYARLLEIPERLRAHTDRLRENVDHEVSRLEQIEAEAAARHGITALQAELGEAQSVLGSIDHGLHESEEAFEELLQRKAKFEAGNDPYFAQAVDALLEQLQREPLPTLLEEARETPGPEDDFIVRALAEAQAEETRLEDTIEEQQQLQGERIRRLTELEQVRRHFKARHFDAGNSGFPDSNTFGRALGDFVGGVLSSRELWRLVLSQQGFRRPKSRSVFGSGGFGRPNRGRVWRNPGFGSSRGRGGFKTGGGF